MKLGIRSPLNSSLDFGIFLAPFILIRYTLRYSDLMDDFDSHDGHVRIAKHLKRLRGMQALSNRSVIAVASFSDG